MKKTLALLLFLIITLSATIALAHPGRTDRNGGHYDRRTGQYHSH